MKKYVLCDIHHHTNNSFDAYKKSAFNVTNLCNLLKGDDETADVKLVCFTDHNYFKYSDYINNYTDMKKQGILCLPGIEINTTGKVHWIIIFNNEELAKENSSGKLKGLELEEKIYGFYKYNQQHPILKQAQQVQCNPISVNDFIDMINSISLEFIAIPHFDKNNGGWFDLLKKDENELQLLNFYIKDNVIIGLESKQIKEKIKLNMRETEKYIDKHITLYEQLENADDENRKNLKLEIEREKEYLSKICKINKSIELASVIYGSDYHGNESAYNKDNLFIMKSELSFEGLKFALLDHESRIMSIEKYRKCLKNNNYVIDNIEIVENGIEKTIELGDGLNCIIGSRGSGKTYFLSMLLGESAKYSTISKSIKLNKINFLNNSLQTKISDEMVDYVSQKNAPNPSKIRKPNIYDLLARAPYDNKVFEDELNNFFKQEPNSKNDIEVVINFFNKMIDEYNNLLKIKNNNLDIKFIDSYNEFFKNNNENNEIYELINNFHTFLNGVVNKKEGNIKKIKEFEEVYNTFIENLKNIFSFMEIKQLFSNEVMENYLKLSEEIFNKISTEGFNNLNNNLNNIKLVKNHVSSIVQVLKTEASNSQRILTDSMLKVKEYVSDMIGSLRKIKKIYHEFSKFDMSNLIDEKNYSYFQGENILNVRFHKSININNMPEELKKEIFNNYLGVSFDGIFEKTFLNRDYGDYFFTYIHPRKDGRRSNYHLQIPNIQPSIYLKCDSNQEQNWIDLSPGQRADILLNIILLNDSNKILIIDQPEDDLDNETIFRKIVKRIRELKFKRQIIVVTHNANMAITADCDYFIICEANNDGKYGIINDTMESINTYEYQSINSNNHSEKQTALEIATEILDGGKEALKHRVKKIGYRNLFLE